MEARMLAQLREVGIFEYPLCCQCSSEAPSQLLSFGRVLETKRFRVRGCTAGTISISRDRAFAGDFDGSFVASLSE
jgi:hypothetical protein